MTQSQVAPMIISQEVDIDAILKTGNLQEICGAQKGQVPEFLRYSSVNCPPGFEPLLDARTIILQRVDPCFGLCKYFFDILNINGEKIMEAHPGGLCDCGFVMRIKNGDQELLYSNRSCLSCLAYCLPFCCCCDKGLRVEAPKGNLLGFVTVRLDYKCRDCCGDSKKRCDCSKCDCKCKYKCDCKCTCNCACCFCGVVTKPIFFIMDPLRQLMMTINVEKLALCPNLCEDPCLLPCYCGSNCRECCLDKIYILRAQDTDCVGAGTIIGELRRFYNGCSDCCRTPPRYQVTFPEDLEIRMKIVVTNAIFLMNHLGY